MNSWGFAGKEGKEGDFEEGQKGRDLGGRSGCMEKYNFGHFWNDLGGGMKGKGDGGASIDGNEIHLILLVGSAFGEFNYI